VPAGAGGMHSAGNMRLRLHALHARPGSHSPAAVTAQLSRNDVHVGSMPVQHTHRELAPCGVQCLEPAKQLRLLQPSKRDSHHGTMACDGTRRFTTSNAKQYKEHTVASESTQPASRKWHQGCGHAWGRTGCGRTWATQRVSDWNM
jgi:hypothetical protein